MQPVQSCLHYQFLALKLSYFLQKNAKFLSAGAPVPDPRASAPPFGLKRRKLGKIVFFLFGHTSGEKPSQFQ